MRVNSFCVFPRIRFLIKVIFQAPLVCLMLALLLIVDLLTVVLYQSLGENLLISWRHQTTSSWITRSCCLDLKFGSRLPLEPRANKLPAPGVMLGLVSRLTQAVSGLRLHSGRPGTAPLSFPLTCASAGFVGAASVPSACLVQNRAWINGQMEGLGGFCMISLLLSVFCP